MGILDDFIKELYDAIFHHILSSEAVKNLEDTVEAIDIFKWGSPLTSGEAHYINDVMVEEVYQGYYEKSAEGFAAVYDEHLRGDFGTLRRGWVTEYIADGFCQNTLEAATFMLLTRTGSFGRAVVDMFSTVEQEPGEPKGVEGRVWAVIWATFFFYLFTAMLGVFFSVLNNPATIMDPGIWFVFLGWWITYAKWYGSYGMYIPGIGTQSFWSAISTIGLFALTVRVVFGLVPFLSLENVPMLIQPSQVIPGFEALVILYLIISAGSMIMGFPPSILLVPFIIPFAVAVPAMAQGLIIPNPLLLGTGHLIMSLAWPTTLMMWGLAGAGNMFYGEWAENQTEVGEMAHTVGREIQKGLHEFYSRTGG